MSTSRTSLSFSPPSTPGVDEPATASTGSAGVPASPAGNRGLAPPVDERFGSLERASRSPGIRSVQSTASSRPSSRQSNFNVAELLSALSVLQGGGKPVDAAAPVKREHYIGTAQPTTPLTPAFRRQYPSCVAANDLDLMIAGIDGRERRFPVDGSGPGLATPATPRTPVRPAIGRHLVAQFDAIYDAHRAAIERLEAEFVHDPDSETIGFRIHGQPAQSLSPRFAAFALPGGRLHLVQPDLRECTSACEEALKGHGKSIEEMTKQLENYRPHGARREVDEICLSLEQAGREVVHLNGAGVTTADSLAMLKEALAQHGPCMLVMNGHARMLDAIDTAGDLDILSIRDPFTGSVMAVRNHEGFWAMANAGLDGRVPANPHAERSWDAIFLRA